MRGPPVSPRLEPGDTVAGDRRPHPASPPLRARSAARELGLPAAVTCPFCGGDQTELHCAFGARLSCASYWCRPCRTAFEWVRPAEPDRL